MLPMPLVLGHRGASGRETENTMESFFAALDDGADGVELDVRLAACGEVVVFHDDDLSRLARDRRSVETLPWGELREISLIDERRIPTLDQVLGELPPSAVINIEIKSPAPGRSGRLVEAVTRVVARHRRTGLILSSFDPTALLQLRAALPKLARGLLFHPEQSRPLREGWLARLLGVSAVHPAATLVTAERMARWRSQGLAVNVWTVDNRDEVRHLAGLGVNAIITNVPDVVRDELTGERSQA